MSKVKSNFKKLATLLDSISIACTGGYSYLEALKANPVGSLGGVAFAALTAYKAGYRNADKTKIGLSVTAAGFIGVGAALTIKVLDDAFSGRLDQVPSYGLLAIGSYMTGLSEVVRYLAEK